MLATELLWGFNRLRAMGPLEVLHRVREKVKRHRSRYSDGLNEFDAGMGKLPMLPGMTLSPDLRDAAMLSQWRRVADAASTGQYRFLSLAWPGVTEAEKWHLDPDSGRNWPRDLYCFDIPLRHNKDYGSVKYVWELNRLQFLQPIAALAAAEQDDSLAHYCVMELINWVDANPPFKGVNWTSGIELALRIVSFCTIIGFVGESAFTEAQRRKIRRTLSAHGYWLERFPSHYSSANNHLIAEAGGLFLLGTLAPDLPGASRYQAYGRRTLIEESQKQILNDGVGAEQSPTYTAFTLEWLLLALHVANSVGDQLPEIVTDRLALAGEYLRWITDDGGNQPRIGDDDEGRVFYSQVGPEGHYVSSVLGCLSAVLSRPDLSPPRRELHLRNLLFGSPTTTANRPEGVRAFKAGGYTVVRDIVNERRIAIILDHGPLGYLSIAAHGHADALALTLHIDNRPVLIDAGTCHYDARCPWRDYFRSTRAHNTLNIAGADQSIISGPFNWAHKAYSRLINLSEGCAVWSIEGEHDGYRKRFGVNHRRRVARGGDRCVIVTDWLSGALNLQDLQIEIRYLVAPDLEVCADGYVAQIRHAGQPICELSFRSHVGQDSAPLLGIIESAFVSPRFGEKQPTTAIVCRIPGAQGLIHGLSTRLEFL